VPLDIQPGSRRLPGCEPVIEFDWLLFGADDWLGVIRLSDWLLLDLFMGNAGGLYKYNRHV